MRDNDSNEQGNAAAGPAFQVGDRVRVGLSTGPIDAIIESIEDGRAWVFGATTSDGHPFSANCPFEHLTLISRATPAPEPDAPSRISAEDWDACYAPTTPAPAPAQPRHTADCEREWGRQEAHNRAWPQHCPTCNGMGQIATRGGYDEPSWTDPCPDCTEKGICPRCGKTGTLKAEDFDGPCSACGWDNNGDDPFCDDRGASCICPEPPDPVYEPEPATPAPAATAPALDTRALATAILANADRAQRLEAALRYDWSELPEPYALVGQLSEQVADLAALYRYLAADVARYLNANSK